MPAFRPRGGDHRRPAVREVIGHLAGSLRAGRAELASFWLLPGPGAHGMSEVLVNGRPIQPESGPKTWAALRNAVDRQAAACDEVVTAVRFRGVDQPSFRGADVDGLSLADLGPIEIETVPRMRLLRTTLGAASLSLADVAAGARGAAAAFRRGQVDDGTRQLSVLLATIRTLVELTLASAAAAGTTLEALPCGTDSAAGLMGSAGVVLDSLAQHQRVQDWVALADGLEYDLAPAILQWGVVFEVMQERCAA